MVIGVVVGVVVVAVIGFVAIVSRRPAAYHVERALTVDAGADRVFAVINDLQAFAGVFVLFGKTLAASTPKTLDGPAAGGVGQSLAWRGDKELGTGAFSISASTPPTSVAITVALTKPMKSTSTCALTVADSGGGSLVTWSMDGTHNFVGKAFGLVVDMDKALGADVEKGLAHLKAAAERASQVRSGT